MFLFSKSQIDYEFSRLPPLDKSSFQKIPERSDNHDLTEDAQFSPTTKVKKNISKFFITNLSRFQTAETDITLRISFES